MIKLHLALLFAFFSVALFGTEPLTTTGVIAEGTKWATPFHIVDSGKDGPTVLITGGVHGNEPAGFRAAEQIRHWPVVAGRLVVVPMVSVPGLRESTRYLPGESDERRDLNRNFPIGADARGALAAAIWKFVQGQEPDWVLDLHEGFEFNISHQPKEGKKRSVGSTIIYFEGEKLDSIVETALGVVNASISDPNRRFVPLKRGPISGSLARACVKKLGAEGLILETTYKDQPLSLRTRQQRTMVNVFLNHIGLIDRDCTDILAADEMQIGLFDGPGTGSPGKVDLPRIVDAEENMTIHFLGPRDIRPEILAQFDVLIFPGGSGSKQAAAIGEKGREHVRDFVRNGGGYVGICAGAFLCSAHYSWSLAMVDASVFTGAREIEGVGRKQMWYRGGATRIEIELSDSGTKLFLSIPRTFDVKYQNGPIISPRGLEGLEDYTTLAWFRSEVARYAPQKNTMIDTPAIVSASFGQGRVISISPHPEADTALESIIADSLRWVTGDD